MGRQVEQGCDRACARSQRRVETRLTILGQLVLGAGVASTDVTIEATAPRATASSGSSLSSSVMRWLRRLAS